VATKRPRRAFWRQSQTNLHPNRRKPGNVAYKQSCIVPV